MNARRAFVSVSLGMAGLMATGCATMVNGTHQELTVTSQPPGLCVRINHAPYGTTPVVASLRRGETYIVQVDHGNSIPYVAQVVPRMGGIVFGNILFGGILGGIVDIGTRSALKHTPDRVHAYFPMSKEEATLMPTPHCQIADYLYRVPRQGPVMSRVNQWERDR